MYTTQTTIIMLLWPIVTTSLFKKYETQKALLLSLFIGVLFLPNSLLMLPGLPPINKRMLISLSFVIALSITGKKNETKIQIRKYDIPIIFLCFVSPIISALVNSMGLYRGVYESLVNFYPVWAIPYWIGRRFISSYKDLRRITKAFILGGIAYVPLILWEIRMSPRLHVMLYGFFAHDWRQHFRYGGYRPIVFMQHGIMVALFVTSATVISFWFWKTGTIQKIGKIPMKYIVPLMIVSSILCRTAAGWVYLFLGILSYYLFRKNKKIWFIKILLAVVPLYVVTRSVGLISAERVLGLFAIVFDDDRIQSMGVRLFQEDVFTEHIVSRALLGWGGLNRAWPVDPVSGERLVRMIDPLWLIIYGKFGYVGLMGMFGALGIGPILVFSLFKSKVFRNFLLRENYHLDAIVISLVVIFFMLDTLANGMMNILFIFCSGALVSFWINIQHQVSNISLGDGNG